MSYSVVFIKKINGLGLLHWFFTGKFTNFLKQQKQPTEVFRKMMFLKISRYSYDNTCLGVCMQAFWLATLLKTPTQMFSCEYCKNFYEHLFWRTLENDCFLNSLSKEHYWAAASVSLNLGNLLTDYKQYQILPETNSFECLDKINPKRASPI